MTDTPKPAETVEETEPVELVETDEPGAEPPADWDPEAHADELDGVEITQED